MTITIPLSKTGKHAGRYETALSVEDAELAALSWTVLITKTGEYAIRGTSVKKNGKWSVVQTRLHRVVAERMLSRPLVKGEEVDHINGDSLDNRRENLRVATKAQNAYNRKKPATNTSGYKGVSWDKRIKRWKAVIGVDGKNIYLGSFDTTEEAHAAYCEAADKYHGEFARLE